MIGIGEKESLLIIHQGALGDLMMSLPALYSLRLFHDGIPWTMAGNLETLSLVHNRFYAQEIISIQKKEWAWLFQEDGRLPEKFGQFLSSFHKAYVFSAHHPEMMDSGTEPSRGEKDFVDPFLPGCSTGVQFANPSKKILDSENIPWLAPEKDRFPDCGRFQKSPCVSAKNI